MSPDGCVVLTPDTDSAVQRTGDKQLQLMRDVHIQNTVGVASIRISRIGLYTDTQDKLKFNMNLDEKFEGQNFH